MMIHFTLCNHNYTREVIGILPQFLSSDNPRSAREQLHKSYLHGGGFHHFRGFTLTAEGPVKDWYLSYPGDDNTFVVAFAKLREETVILFENAWVAVVQPDKSFVISRMD